jgi:hypothetical protein
MAISDEELVRQLDAVPQVEPPEMKTSILARLRAPHPPFGHLLPASGAKDLKAETPRLAKRRVRGVAIGLAWAAAIIIVVTVVVERKSLPWQHVSATIAPPVDKWPIVARAAVPEEGKLIVRRSGDQFAIQPSATTSEAISVAWDQKKLEIADVVSDPEVLILQRKNGASGSAVIQLNVGGREVLRTVVSLD